MGLKVVFIAMVLLVCGAAACPVAHALSTPNVPPSSHLYRDVDKLIALGYARPSVVGQRPWARSEFARLIAQAIKTRDERGEIKADSYRDYSKQLVQRYTVDWMIRRLADEFHEELVEMGAIPGKRHAFRIHPLEKIDVGIVGMKSPPTTIPYANGVGTISADVNPFGNYNEGRHAVDGMQGALETVHRFGLTKFFSVYLRPRFEASVARTTGDGDASALVQNFYAVFEARNFSLEFGRDSVVWGMGQYGGTMLTYNARPLDMVKITNPHPARLPWVFRHLGEWRYTFFGANLGPSYVRKYGWLAGWQLNLLTSRWVELGFGHLVMMGGEGSPSLSALDVIGEFFGFRPSGSDPNSVNKANQMFEAGILVRIPPLRGMQIYGMLTNEDKRDSIKRFFRDGSSYLVGMYLPALGTCGKADFRMEYTRTCALCFRHSLFADGATINRRLLGTNLGPDADGIHAQLNYDISDASGVGLSVDWDHRRSDIHDVEVEPDGSQGDVITVEHRPAENRYRGVVMTWWEPSDMVRLMASLGYERVENFRYAQGDGRNNILASILLSIDLDRLFYYGGD